MCARRREKSLSNAGCSRVGKVGCSQSNQPNRLAMSEFKYACPVRGEHIKCDSTQSGTTMECPTCFQKIVAPQAPATQDPNRSSPAPRVGEVSRPGGGGECGGDAPAGAGKKFFPSAYRLYCFCSAPRRWCCLRSMETFCRPSGGKIHPRAGQSGDARTNLLGNAPPRSLSHCRRRTRDGC